MILNRGNIWSVYGRQDCFIFTGNSYLKQNGALVMGAGIAKEVRDKFPGLDMRFGKWIDKQFGGHLGFFGFTAAKMKGGPKVGVFQTKRHFKDDSDLELIKKSVAALALWIRLHKPKRVDMNFPGIGHGNLNRDDVLEIINELPDVVNIWEF